MYSGINKTILAFLPAMGVLGIEFIGFILVFQMWRLRNRLKVKYGARSYRRIFPVGLAGILLIIMLSFNQFIPYFNFSPLFWVKSRLTILVTPLDLLTGPAVPVLFIIKCVFAFFLLCLGVLMALRALITFGFDYMTVVYLYFPEESTIQDNKIYSAIRHPAYGAVIIINLAGMFFTLTLFSIMFFIIYVLGFWLHIRFVEEKDLLVRFGKSYVEYRKKVPAFFVYPKNFGVLLSFLAGK